MNPHSRFPQLIALALILTFLPTNGAQGQEAAVTKGTADFRNPPLLSDGLYEDTIVTGESVWYSVIYRNGEQYRIAANLTDTDVDSEEDVELEAGFVSPTLDEASSGRILEGTARYTGGTTNLWYIRVDLPTEGRLGVEHTLSLDISGMQATRLGPCDALPDCDLDSDLGDIEARIQGLEASMAQLSSADAKQVIDDEMDDLERRNSTAESELDEADGAIAAVCAPAPDCDTAPEPAASTPPWALVVGSLILLSGAGFLLMTLRGRRP